MPVCMKNVTQHAININIFEYSNLLYLNIALGDGVIILDGTDKGTAAITFAGVLVWLASSACKTLVQFEQPAHSGLPEVSLALIFPNQVQLDLSEDLMVVVALAKLFLTPASGKTS